MLLQVFFVLSPVSKQNFLKQSQSFLYIDKYLSHYNKLIERSRMQGKAKSFKIEHRKLILVNNKEGFESNGLKNARIIPQNNSKIFKRASSIQNKQRPSKTKEKISRSKQNRQKISILPNFRESTENSSDRQLHSKSSSGKIFPFFDKIEKQIHLIGRNSQLEILIKQLLSTLRDKFGIFQCQVNCFTIEKDFFVHLLQYLICMLSCVDTVDCNRLFHKMSELKGVFQLIHEYSQSHRKKQYLKRVQICQNITSFGYNHVDYEVQMSSKKKLMQQYSNQCNFLKEKLSIIQKQVQQKQSYVLHLTNQLSLHQRSLHQLLSSLSTLKQQQVKFKNQAEVIKERYEDLLEKIKSLQRYGSQQRQTIRMASQQYKSIEADIYQYAVYLQSNQLASKIDFEPHPYTEMQKVFLGDFEELVLMGTANKRCDEQTKRFKDLYARTLSFFIKKDCDMKELLNFRAKCVREFIMQMKKWLRNWQLKQEYLANLRGQFVIKNQVLKKLMDHLHSASKIIDKGQINGLIAQVNKEYSNIEENYKLGNSFY